MDFASLIIWINQIALYGKTLIALPIKLHLPGLFRAIAAKRLRMGVKVLAPQKAKQGLQCRLKINTATHN